MENDCKRSGSVCFRFDGISHDLTISSIGSPIGNLTKRACCSAVSQIDSGAGEPTMVDLNKPSRKVLPFTGEPTVIEVLERLHNSYGGLSARDALSGADRAVLASVEITL
jgi:hypothetical protein